MKIYSSSRINETVHDGLNCKVCGYTLKWGEFAYQQTICFSCFKDKFFDILDVYGISGTERQLLTHLMAMTAEIYGYKL